MERDFESNDTRSEKKHDIKSILKSNKKLKNALKVGLVIFGVSYAPVRQPLLNAGIMAGQVVANSLETIRNADFFKRAQPLSDTKQKSNEAPAKLERPTYELVIESADIQRMAEFTGSKIRLNATHTVKIPTQGALRFISPATEFDAKSKTNVYLVVDLQRSFIDGGRFARTIYLDEPLQKTDFLSEDNAVKLYVPPIKISSIEVEDFRITRKLESAVFRIKPEDEEKAIAQYRNEIRQTINEDKEYYNFVSNVTYRNLEKALEDLFGINFSVIPLPEPAEQANAHERQNDGNIADKKSNPYFEMWSDIDKVLLATDRFQTVPRLGDN